MESSLGKHNERGSVKTFFASPGRSTEELLAAEIAYINSYPIVTGLLDSIGGLLAILNEHRQLIALNDPLLSTLGVADPQAALGLRPGEALQCVYSHDEPAGCGTTRFCSTCGAAIAMVVSLGEDSQVERICSLKARHDGKDVDIVLNVRSCPIRLDGKRFLLLFLQDVTQQQQKAALERTFFHDISNMLSMLHWSSEQLAKKEPSKYADIISQASSRLLKEVAIQRCLSNRDECDYQPRWETVAVETIVHELRDFFAGHSVAEGKKLVFQDYPRLSFKSDSSLLLRVLSNMLTNALEASAPGDDVRVWVEQHRSEIMFCVWNTQEIAADIGLRIFQRNFSTKEGPGRGLGTFSMKFFGEGILGGKVSFESSATAGTTFRLVVPG